MIPTEEFVAPTLEELQAQALDYFKENKPKVYRAFKKDNEMKDLEDICLNRAKQAKAHAEYLISSGTSAPQAWLTATRLYILESETD